ncbi:MAG TPA: hypothetical protein PLO65_11275 [Caulobacter sp.]|nr:hypothetical protein [Caulobacter sp.]
MSDPQPLSPEQEAVRDKIVAAGEGWGSTEQQVDIAVRAELGDTPVYDLRFPRGGGGYVGDTEYIPPDGGPPITIPGDGASAYDCFW